MDAIWTGFLLEVLSDSSGSLPHTYGLAILKHTDLLNHTDLLAFLGTNIATETFTEIDFADDLALLTDMLYQY